MGVPEESARRHPEEEEYEAVAVLEEAEKIDWVPLTFSLVEYPKGDLLGLFFAFSSFAPLTLETGFFAVLFFRRDLFTIAFYLGFLLNEPVNQFIKHAVKQPRPLGGRHQYGIYGMPSSHSQHSWFFAVFGILVVFVRTPEGDPLEQIGLVIWLVSCATVVAYGRIYLKYHTCLQVLVGGIIGSVYAVLWFSLIHFILTPFFPSIVSWSVSQYFLIRDTTNIPNLLWFEYNNTINYGNSSS